MANKTTMNKTLATLAKIPPELENMSADIKLVDQKLGKEMNHLSDSIESVQNNLIKTQANLMAEAFVLNAEYLVTKDYLDARIGQLRAEIYSEFRLIKWMMGIGFAELVLPQLQAWFS